MKKCLLIIGILTVMLSSCGTTVYQLNTDCSKITTEDLFKNISTLLLKEGFIIKQNDVKNGYLQAETIPTMNVWIGMETRYWIFQLIDGKVIAYAKVTYIKQNAFGATTGSSEIYYSDNSNEDWTWYWNVRNGLERICNNKIVITEKKQN